MGRKGGGGIHIQDQIGHIQMAGSDWPGPFASTHADRATCAQIKEHEQTINNE